MGGEPPNKAMKLTRLSAALGWFREDIQPSDIEWLSLEDARQRAGRGGLGRRAFLARAAERDKERSLLPRVCRHLRGFLSAP